MELGWLDDVECFFSALSLLRDVADSPEWTFIRNKSLTKDVKDHCSQGGWYSCSSFGMGEALKQNTEQ